MRKKSGGIQLLLVEDNPGDALLVEEFVIDEFENADLTHVSTLHQAAASLQSDHSFDAILLDLSLPDSNGIDLVQSVLDVADNIPVVVLTGYSNLDFSVKSLSKGVSDYLLKDELSSTLLYKSIIYSIERNAFSSQLKKSERNYRHLFEFSPEPMWVYDLHTLMFLDINKAAIQHYGYSKEEFLNMTIKEIRPPEDIDKLQSALDEILSQPNENNSGIYRHKKKSGEIIQVEVEGSAIEYKDREARLILANDITEKLQEQERLKQLESVITNTTELVVILEAEVTDKGGRQIIYVNDAFTEITQYKREEVLGNSLLFLNGPKTDPEEIEKLKQSMDNWNACNVEYINYKKDGTPFWINMSLVPVADKNGHFTQWVAIGRNISKQKEYELQLEESLDEKEVLLSEIHHRVKNNLAVVSSLLQLQAIKAKNNVLEKKLYDSVFRISTMATIHELLYQSGSFSKLNFSEIIEKLINNLENVWATEKNISYKIEKEPIQLNINQAIPCSLLINEVITNVYKHAFEGLESGQVFLKLSCVDDQVHVRISDNGVGFPDNIEMDNDDATESLGLHLIEVLTTQLRGKSRFSSEGKGTTFTLTFTRAEASGIGSYNVK